MVALEVFAGRERHRSLNAEVVLQGTKRTCLAGGRTFGSMRLDDIQARLSCSPLGSAAGKPDLSASSTAALYRVAGDYDTVRALCNPSVAGGFLTSLHGLLPATSRSSSCRTAGRCCEPCLMSTPRAPAWLTMNRQCFPPTAQRRSSIDAHDLPPPRLRRRKVWVAAARMVPRRVHRRPVQ